MFFFGRRYAGRVFIRFVVTRIFVMVCTPVVDSSVIRSIHKYGSRCLSQIHIAWRKMIWPEIRRLKPLFPIAPLNNFLSVCKNSSIRARKIELSSNFIGQFADRTEIIQASGGTFSTMVIQSDRNSTRPVTESSISRKQNRYAS